MLIGKLLCISPAQSFSLEVDDIAADKSISHRCAMFSLLTDKPSVIKNYLLAEDTLHTLEIAKTLGLEVEEIDSHTMRFTPPKKIKEPNCILDCGNAGTGMRLYAGLLSGVEGFFVLSGDKYLCARPMNRIIQPLQSIGARIHSRAGGFAPMAIIGSQLDGFNYQSPISSAQVKSAMILAALHAKDKSTYIENESSRDHTEKMLIGMGAEIKKHENTIHISPLTKPLESMDFAIPADPSSAFFFALAAAIVPGSEILLKNVVLNKTRIQAFEILKQMGAKVTFTKTSSPYEEVGDIYVAYAPLHGITIDSHISWLIDELPALGIAMAVANDKSEVKNAKELRVKETDRIHALLVNLRALGVECEEREDGYVIYGGTLKTSAKPASIQSFGDHRIAMSFAIAGLVSAVEISDYACISISFPNFDAILCRIQSVKYIV